MALLYHLSPNYRRILSIRGGLPPRERSRHISRGQCKRHKTALSSQIAFGIMKRPHEEGHLRVASPKVPQLLIGTCRVEGRSRYTARLIDCVTACRHRGLGSYLILATGGNRESAAAQVLIWLTVLVGASRASKPRSG
jgi:hypothetical protein